MNYLPSCSLWSVVFLFPSFFDWPEVSPESSWRIPSATWTICISCAIEIPLSEADGFAPLVKLKFLRVFRLVKNIFTTRVSYNSIAIPWLPEERGRSVRRKQPSIVWGRAGARSFSFVEVPSTFCVSCRNFNLLSNPQDHPHVQVAPTPTWWSPVLSDIESPFPWSLLDLWTLCLRSEKVGHMLHNDPQLQNNINVRNTRSGSGAMTLRILSYDSTWNSGWAKDRYATSLLPKTIDGDNFVLVRLLCCGCSFSSAMLDGGR